MPVSRKKDFIREITMMIRKESIEFEPGDRVVITSGSGKSARTYSVGSVYHDFDSGRLCFRLYGADGHQIVPDDGPLYLEDRLTSSQMKSVAERVSEYVAKSVCRARNLAAVRFAVENAPDGDISLEDAGSPLVRVDRFRVGTFEELSLRKVFVEGDNLYSVVEDPGTGHRYNYPLSDLSDIAVSKVSAAVENVLGRRIQDSETYSVSSHVREEVPHRPRERRNTSGQTL